MVMCGVKRKPVPARQAQVTTSTTPGTLQPTSAVEASSFSTPMTGIQAAQRASLPSFQMTEQDVSAEAKLNRFDEARYLKDEDYRTFIQSLVTGKTVSKTFEDFRAERDERESNRKLAQLAMPSHLEIGIDPNTGFNYTAASQQRMQVIRMTNARISAHNHAIDVRQEAAAGVRLATINLRDYIKDRCLLPPYTVSIQTTGLSRDQYQAVPDLLKATYFGTPNQKDWVSITGWAVAGALSFGTLWLGLLSKGERNKAGVKERQVELTLASVNDSMRTAGIEAQWHLQTIQALPPTWELSLLRCLVDEKVKRANAATTEPSHSVKLDSVQGNLPIDTVVEVPSTPVDIRSLIDTDVRAPVISQPASGINEIKATGRAEPHAAQEMYKPVRRRAVSSAVPSRQVSNTSTLTGVTPDASICSPSSAATKNVHAALLDLNAFGDHAPLPNFDPQIKSQLLTTTDPNAHRPLINAWGQELEQYPIVVPKLPQERPVGGGAAPPQYGYEMPSLSRPNDRNWATEAELRANPKELQRCDPFEFSYAPRSPEILYTDKIGIQIPGVGGTAQCDSFSEHEIARWSFANWPEYGTQFASHGITYEDFYRMLSGSIEILQRAPFEVDTFYLKQMVGWGIVTAGIAPAVNHYAHREGGFATGHLKGHRGTGRDLKNFFYDVTSNLRTRGVPVVIKFKQRDGALMAKIVRTRTAVEENWGRYDIVLRHYPLDLQVRHENRVLAMTNA